MVRKKLGRGRKNRCRFCTKEGCPRPAFVDYKDVQGLKKMCTSQGKLFSRKRSGNSADHQVLEPWPFFLLVVFLRLRVAAGAGLKAGEQGIAFRLLLQQFLHIFDRRLGHRAASVGTEEDREAAEVFVLMTHDLII